MKHLRFRTIVILMFTILLWGCKRESNEGKIVPSPTAVPSITQKPSPTLSAIERYEAEEAERERIKAELMVSPTPGPEAYSILAAERQIREGDVVTMGNYMHTLNQDIFDYSMPIKWLVLEQTEEKALLISLFNIDVKRYVELESSLRYESEGINVTWENCDIRVWLNGFFKEVAFSEREKSCILKTKVHTPDDPVYGTEGGDDTMDYLFLLSVEEVQKYFVSDEERRTQIVPDVNPWDEIIYAPNEHKPNTTDYYDWWLRSPGKENNQVACVERFGEVVTEGISATDFRVSVRPAMWVDLNKVREVGLETITEE